MSFSCPKCKSENTQKYSVIFKSGTSGVDLSTIGAGVGSGIGVGVASTKGTTQSDLAKTYGPPVKMPYFAPVVGLLTIGIVTSIFFGIWCMYVVGAILIAYWLSAYKNNEHEYPKLFAEWDEKFLCLRCENTFKPIDESKTN